MPRTPALDHDTRALLAKLERFEASESIANTGTGSRREGAQFEQLIFNFWTHFCGIAENAGAAASVVRGSRSRSYTQLTFDTRTLYVPASTAAGAHQADARLASWLEVAFGVTDLISAYPTEAEAVRRYAPAQGTVRGRTVP